MSKPLLIELFTEELPPKALKMLGEEFRMQIFNVLSKARVADRDPGVAKGFSTPRRLAVLIDAVEEKSPDVEEEVKLMPAKVGLEADGNPTQALRKKAASLSIDIDSLGAADLLRRSEGTTEFLFARIKRLGQPLNTIVEHAVNQAISRLPIPKVMSYQLPDGITTVKFVRPAHGLVALHGDTVVNINALGLKAGRTAHGHRFLGQSDITLDTATDYETRLEDAGKVIASFDRRRSLIEQQLKAKAAELDASLGAHPDDYAGLLDEVTALVEWPVVYAAEFDPAFLEVPQECLILTMRTNQKYFPLFDAAGKLTHRFLIVSNMEVADPRAIVGGNQRVVRPRLEDARFFYNQDRRERLEARISRLGQVVYHNRLGSQLERVERVAQLASGIARALGTDHVQAGRAARLAKADLVTGMVGEFPELQGIMGRYYALHDGEPVAIADAIAEHYQPRFAGDRLPQHPVSCAVALADKLETLAGLFGIGQLPSGDRDPFALRRHALGVIRILVERDLPLRLDALIDDAFSVFPKELKLADARAELENFVFERMRGYFSEQGYSVHQIDAVLSLRPLAAHRIALQLAAVRAFAELPEAASLAAANKRVANILRQAEGKTGTGGKADARLLQEPAERALFDALQTASAVATPLFERGDYTGYLKTFAVLKAPVDAFFDGVMVMAEDAALRRNRIALLADLQREMNRIADIARLAA
jgi:glycyl-tRNA synthetase beta chain